MVMTTDGRSEIAFFDVETTVPTRSGQGFAILEFGAILVCPRKLVELESFSTLVRPSNLSLISTLSVRCNGITKDAVVSAPKFSDVADKVYDLLHGRIWAGHNILRFDCPRIREAFSQINRPPPEPKGTIDSLALLTQKFGRRAGDMKMATLATYFGLGQQTHRSLDDVRMNLEVLKYCATVLFLESSLPDIFTVNSWVSPNATTRRSNNGKSSPEDMKLREDTPSSSTNIENQSSPSLLNPAIVENYSILSLVNPNTREEVPNQRKSTVATPTPFDMSPLSDEMEREPFISDDSMEDKSHSESFISDDSMEDKSHSESLESSADESNVSNSSALFLAPDKVFIDHISAVFVPFYRGIQRIQILHKNVMLQVYCSNFKVQFGISTKYFDYAGRPRLSFVVQAPPNLCQVLDACDNRAQKLSMDSGSSSEWRRVVTRKATFNSPTVRLHLPTVVDRNVASWATEIYQKELSATHRLDFSRFDVGELVALIIPGILVDAYFSLDPYDFQQNAGIRLVAKRLIIHSN